MICFLVGSDRVCAVYDNNGNPIGYLNGLNLNSDLVDKDKWTVDLIKARTDKLVKEILEMFSL